MKCQHPRKEGTIFQREIKPGIKIKIYIDDALKKEIT
jgi:hypothetical protein